MVNDKENNSQPFFSVIIPTYNRAELVVKAIRSVLGQSDLDFEILVVDNGSTDETESAIKQIVDERIRYYYRDPSGGPAWPRNLGISRAYGEWICFLDSDDVWYKEKLSTVRKYIGERSETAMVHWQAEMDGNEKRVRILRPDPYTYKSYQRMLLTENTIVTSTVCIKRKILEELNLKFQENLGYLAIEDYDFWLRFLFGSGSFFCIPTVLGEMHTPPNRSGTTGVFWSRLPLLYEHHAYEFQSFAKCKYLLYLRLLSGLAIRKGFSSLRKKNFFIGVGYLLESVFRNPFEIFRYSIFRIQQRIRLRS